MKRMDRAEFEADVRIIAAAFQRARIEDGKKPLSEEENEAAIRRLVEAKCGTSSSQTRWEIKTNDTFSDRDL